MFLLLKHLIIFIQFHAAISMILGIIGGMCNEKTTLATSLCPDPRISAGAISGSC
jgi:uncharacterized protein YneF (UPF0154 family)